MIWVPDLTIVMLIVGGFSAHTWHENFRGRGFRDGLTHMLERHEGEGYTRETGAETLSGERRPGFYEDDRGQD